MSKAALVFAGGKGSRLLKPGFWTKPKPILRSDRFDFVKNHLLGLTEMGADRVYYLLGYRADEVGSYVQKVAKEYEVPVGFIFGSNPKYGEKTAVDLRNALSNLSNSGYDVVYVTLSDNLLPYQFLAGNGILESLPKGTPISQLIDTQYKYNDPNNHPKVKVIDGKITESSKIMDNYYGIKVSLALVDALRILDYADFIQKTGKEDLTSLYKFIDSRGISEFEELGPAPWFNINTEAEFYRVNQELKNLGSRQYEYFPKY